MTKQETFDIVSKHLLTQNERSVTVYPIWSASREVCSYRGLNGMMCAAGCLIPDELYSKDMENGVVGGADSRSRLITNAIESLGHDPKLVRQLQLIHDQKLPSDWAHYLRALAFDYNLDPSVLA